MAPRNEQIVRQAYQIAEDMPGGTLAPTGNRMTSRVRVVVLVPRPASPSPERNGQPRRRARRRTRHAGDEGERQEDRRRPVRGDIARPHAPAQRGHGPDRPTPASPRRSHRGSGTAPTASRPALSASSSPGTPRSPCSSGPWLRPCPRGTPSRSRCPGRPRSWPTWSRRSSPRSARCPAAWSTSSPNPATLVLPAARRGSSRKARTATRVRPAILEDPSPR
jgi:hypothetical protein